MLNAFLGDTVFIQGAAATPIPLVEAMTAVGKEASLKDIKICHMHTEGPAPYADKDCQGKHCTNRFCSFWVLEICFVSLFTIHSFGEFVLVLCTNENWLIKHQLT
jgi:hypothetical protein